METPNTSSANIVMPPAETHHECPLRGASYASITHFKRKIITLDLTKEYFEDADQSIVEYSESVTTENDKLGIRLDERMINHLFTIQVLDLWDFESPMTVKLLSQLDCPKMKRFWELRTSPEKFNIRNSNDTHSDFHWSQSQPPVSKRAEDKGLVLVENGEKTVVVPMIGIISDLEELDFTEVRTEIKRANPKINISTMVAVLEGILKNVYFDPLQAVREQRLKEIETIKTMRRERHRNRPSAKETTIGGSSSPSKPQEPGKPAVATTSQTSTKASPIDVSTSTMVRKGE